LSSTTHPKTDGQSERTIQILEDMLRAYIIDFRRNWAKYLPLVKFAYNNSHQSTIGMPSLKHFMIEDVELQYVGNKSMTGGSMDQI